MTLYVTKGSGPSLLGREWLKSIRLDWKTIGLASMDPITTQVNALVNKYGELFKDGLGTMKKIKAELRMKKDATPRFHRPRPVPFALREAVEQELAEMEAKGVIRKVSHSQWASPVVPKTDAYHSVETIR